MRFRLRTLLISRRWLRFSLRGMLVVITLFGIWLGFQVNWLRQRREARRWIEQHETRGGWSGVDPTRITVTKLDGTTYQKEAVNAPLSLRLLVGENRLAYIKLDKSKLSEADIPRLNALHALFPEAEGVDIFEPGAVYRWGPPPDPRAYLKYPTRNVGGKMINQPVDAASN